MQLDDVGLGNRRITVGGHVRPLDELTRRAVLDRLDHRRNRRPNTANPHLLITQKTAVELGPAGKLWTTRATRATRNLTATLERLRADRQLEEALTHGADPLRLALVFGIDEKTAIRHADSTRKRSSDLSPEMGPGRSP
ncbi:hypothetical protein ACLQ18_35220 [Streptomyces sp. DT193]|uniref:hypothetical protein n=1 Tax=Streptomyces sp. DT193 TaxID=3393418 RepID=UPI003CF78F2A